METFAYVSRVDCLRDFVTLPGFRRLVHPLPLFVQGIVTLTRIHLPQWTEAYGMLGEFTELLKRLSASTLVFGRARAIGWQRFAIGRHDSDVDGEGEGAIGRRVEEGSMKEMTPWEVLDCVWILY